MTPAPRSLQIFGICLLAPPQLVIFGVIDLLGALWPWRALRVEPRA